MTLHGRTFQGEFDTLENIADTISQTVGCPVTIEDAQHRLLAYSSHNQEFTDEARLATIIRRRVPEEVINSLWKSGVIQKLSDSVYPVRVSSISSVGLGDRVAIAVRQHRDLLGYIWLIEARPLGREEFEYLKEASIAVSIKLLQLRARRKKEDDGRQEFFWRLLTGHIESHESIVESAARFKVVLPERYSVVIFQFEEEITPDTEEQVRYVVSTTQKIRTIMSVIDRKQMILLISTHGQDFLSEDYCVNFIVTTMSRLQERFGSSPASGSCGNIYSQYDRIRNSYLEARAVFRLKRRFPDELSAVYTYSHLGFYRYLPMITDESHGDVHLNPALERLREYDARHQARLMETLEVFLNHDTNIKQAADILHVHINTLTYRLRRISEVGQVDLRDMNQKCSLFIDLKMEKFLD